jgi:acetyl esterase
MTPDIDRLPEELRRRMDADMALAFATEAERAALLPPPADLAEDRARGLAAAAFWAEGAPEVRSIETLTVPGPAGPIEVRLFRGAIEAPAPVVLYVHGGGWAQGSIAQNEPMIRALVAASGWTVAALHYRLAPEHPYPAGLDDCVALARWLHAEGPAHGLDPTRLVTSGTSAGANLALATGLALPARGLPAPAGMALFYGIYGADLDTASYREFADGRFGLPRARMASYFDWYDPNGARATDPLIQPLLADLAGLPPIWLAAAGLDVLRDDTLELHRRLVAAGVRVTLRYEPGVPHGFINRGRMVQAARSSLAAAAAFLAELLADNR